MKVVFWQNIPSIHQAPLIREVAKKNPDEVTVVAENDLSRDRLEQGWASPDFSPAKLLVSPTIEQQDKFLEKSNIDTFHIFSGFHAYPCTYRIFKNAVQKKLPVAVFVEPGSTGSVKDKLRICRYRIHALRWNKHISFIIATGQLGVNYYKKCGFEAPIIFPFAYFVESLYPNNISSYSNGDILKSKEVNSKLLFVGQLIWRKGLDLILSALAKIKSRNWVLNVVGSGPKLDQLREYARKQKIADRVNWLGVLPNRETRSLMTKSDCFVLPSRHDGWGAVVNEALIAGTPVVVSDACGSSDLICEPWIGDVFSAGSSDDLANVLKRRTLNGSLSQAERLRISTWAEQTISPQKGAEYLLGIIDFCKAGKESARPVAPWRKKV